MKSIRTLAPILVTALLLTACAKDENVIATVDPYTGTPEKELFQKAEAVMAKGHYEQASVQFESLENQYPFGEYAQRGLRDLMFSYYKSGDVTAASATAKRYTQLYPRAADVDYAYYLRGVSEYEQDHGLLAHYLPFDPSVRDLGTMMDAYNDFDFFLKHYPRSQYAADVKQRMIFLRNMLAKKELAAAEFYFDRKAYVASAMRAGLVLKNFQQSPQAERALVILTESNQHLGLQQEANDASQVLRESFGKKTNNG